MQTTIPLPDHPYPQFKRQKWENLNGTWDFSIDYGESGRERGLSQDASQYKEKILVPFCPESKLSGIENLDFMPVLWYHRTFKIPSEWKPFRIFLNFGAVDYQCEVWANNKKVGIHCGGSTRFSFEITDALTDGDNDVYVRVEDRIRSYDQPAGKQTQSYENIGCCYTRTTGIWQTVWLEARPESFINSVHVMPDADNGRFIFTAEIENCAGASFKVGLYGKNGQPAAEGLAAAGGITVILDVENPELWNPDNPYLYDVKYSLMKDGIVLDEVDGYAALRKVHVEGNTYYLNNVPIFLRFALIQGFYADGVWTAPDDQTLKGDIERALDVGFNGARLHEKVFQDRFQYWADKLGFMVWAEFPDWGCLSTYDNVTGFHNLKREWIEAVAQQRNHPCIIAWTPLNEAANINEAAWEKNAEDYIRAVRELYDVTKLLDPTRPVNDASGYIHVKTDLITVHNYDHDAESFSKTAGKSAFDNYKNVFYVPDDYLDKDIVTVYKGDKPFIIDEYDGAQWLPGFENQPRDRAEFGKGRSAEEIVRLLRDLTAVLTDNPHMAGFCYTQLYDVMNEQNGVYTYEREPKYNAEELRDIFAAPAAYLKDRENK